MQVRILARSHPNRRIPEGKLHKKHHRYRGSKTHGRRCNDKASLYQLRAKFWLGKPNRQRRYRDLTAKFKEWD